MRRTLALASIIPCLLAGPVAAQQDGPPNAILLIAKPGLQDPNFRQTVVLVTQAADGGTVGVILNRPTEAKDEQSGQPISFGGPVMTQVTVALFRSATLPRGASFPVLKDVYLSMHPAVLEPLRAAPPENYRLYSGFAGWAPRQLESEMERDDWLLLPASEELLFRRDTEDLWRELLERALEGKKPHVLRDSRRYTFGHEAPDSRPLRLHLAFM